MCFGHRKEIRKLTSRALALRRSESRNCGLCVFYIQKCGATLLVCALTCDHTLPPLYSDAEKEGMIHLLVGSYVKKRDSGVFSDWSRNNAYETLHSYWLSYFNLISGQKVGLARRKQNGGDRARF